MFGSFVWKMPETINQLSIIVSALKTEGKNVQKDRANLIHVKEYYAEVLSYIASYIQWQYHI